MTDDPNVSIRDIILFDRITGHKEAVNVNTDGELAQIQYVNLGFPVFVDCYDPVISKNGRTVAFVTTANNLDLLHPDPWWDDSVFVRDLWTGITEVASVGNNWFQYRQRSYAPSISADGQKVAFISNAPLLPIDTNWDRPDVYVRNLTDKTTQIASLRHTGQPHFSWAPIQRTVISGDGTKVFFTTANSELVADDADSFVNLFRTDLTHQQIQRIDTTADGFPANGGIPSGQSFATSFDGNIVSFISSASNLTPGSNNFSANLFTRNISAGTLWPVAMQADGTIGSGSEFAVT